MNELVGHVMGKKDPIPITPAQQQLFYFQQLNPESAAYNSSVYLRLEGNLDPQLLSDSIDWVINKHDILRTNFIVENEVPIQVIRSNVENKVEIIEMESRQEEELANIVSTLIDTPFNLSNDPLLRSLIIKKSNNIHYFLLVTHHIVSDSWFKQIFNEISTYYNSCKDGIDITLNTKLSFQFADYALWQEQQIKKGAYENQKILAQKLDNPPDSSIIADFKRGSDNRYVGTSEFIKFSKELQDKIKMFCKKNELLHLSFTLRH